MAESPIGESIAVDEPAIEQDATRSDAPVWPTHSEQSVVFLIDAASPLEEKILHQWIESARPEHVSERDVSVLRIASSRRPRRTRGSNLDPTLASSDKLLLAPLRVIWLPEKRAGERVASLRDLLRFGDPRDPGRVRAAFIRRTYAHLAGAL